MTSRELELHTRIIVRRRIVRYVIIVREKKNQKLLNKSNDMIWNTKQVVQSLS